MANYLPENPFTSTTYYGSEYFCDRKKESEKLLSNAINGNSTTIIAIRRIGKTGLIRHVLSQLPENFKGIYIDILETNSLNQFFNIIATAIISTVPEKSSFGKQLWSTIKSMRPVISYDALTGAPEATFDLKKKEVENNIDTLLQLLESQSFKTIIAIDEFQQITKYAEKNTESWLRSRVQQLKNVVFIFSGSQQHLMTEMFSSPDRPFYRSTMLLKLEKLDTDVYADFIVEMFQKYKKTIARETALEIIEWTDTHTFYTQQLCNRVFATCHKKATSEIWKSQASELLKEQEVMFFSFRNLLTTSQWNLLKAIARENIVYQPTAKDFIFKNQLGTSASVLRSLNSLIDSELVYRDFDSKGTQYYSVYDVYLKKWCMARQY